MTVQEVNKVLKRRNHKSIELNNDIKMFNVFLNTAGTCIIHFMLHITFKAKLVLFVKEEEFHFKHMSRYLV